MPATTRIYVKASIVYLCLGAVIGALLLVNRWLPLGPAVGSLRTGHAVILLVGWLTQLIFGVGWWLFPALKIDLHAPSGRWRLHGQSQRGSETLFWATFACLNAGVLLLAALGPLRPYIRPGPLDVVGELLLLAAAVLFVVNGVWLRIRELGRAR